MNLDEARIIGPTTRLLDQGGHQNQTGRSVMNNRGAYQLRHDDWLLSVATSHGERSTVRKKAAAGAEMSPKVFGRLQLF